jgi:hypothetical protein
MDKESKQRLRALRKSQAEQGVVTLFDSLAEEAKLELQDRGVLRLPKADSRDAGLKKLSSAVRLEKAGIIDHGSVVPKGKRPQRTPKRSGKDKDFNGVDNMTLPKEWQSEEAV